MQIRIEAMCDSTVMAVEAFNKRLADSGSSARIRLPASPRPNVYSPHQGLPQELFLAIDDSDAVRGAYTLKHQNFWIDGQVVPVCDLQYPVSEAIVNRKYTQVAARLMLDALKRHPLMYGLGMGGQDEEVARLFKATGYAMATVPFYFRVVHPFAFLRNIEHLRKSVWKRIVLDSMAYSGLGWLAVKLRAQLRSKSPSPLSTQVEVVDAFGVWTDDVWSAARDGYKFCSLRDAATMNSMYPNGLPDVIRLKISVEGRPVGWTLAMNNRLQNHRHFGNMRLGSIIDGFARREHLPTIIEQTRLWLVQAGADLIVSNQMHAAWTQALRDCGFMGGRSNFLFASSPALAKLLEERKITSGDIHVNRSDGDGPINL